MRICGWNIWVVAPAFPWYSSFGKKYSVLSESRFSHLESCEDLWKMSYTEKLLLNCLSLSPRFSQVRCGGDTTSPRPPIPQPCASLLGISCRHIGCKACHRLRVTSNRKSARKPHRTAVCLDVGTGEYPRRIANLLGRWSSIVAPGQISDRSHLMLAMLGQLPCSMGDSFYFQEKNIIWHRWQYHLCVAVILSVINRYVSVPQQFCNILLRCHSEQNVKTQMLFPLKVSLRNGSQSYHRISSPTSCSQEPPFSISDQLQASWSSASRGPCQLVQSWAGNKSPVTPIAFSHP